MAGASEPVDVSTKRQRIAQLARQSPEMGFTSLAYFIDVDWLREAYRLTRKDGAVGVDGQTGEDYAKDLEGNLRSLLERAKSGIYQAPPVRRVHIPKAGSATETRPLGIPMRHSYCTSLQQGWGLRRERPALPWACLDQEADRRAQERRAGLRKRAIVSGVNRIHQGPCGVDWRPSRTPDLHQSAIVETVTFSKPAATPAEQRPSAR
jgi:hypothetical protein